MINIDFNNISDELVYQEFGVDGNETEALNDIYLELFELLGKEGMLRMCKHFRGDKMDFPMRLYRPEFVADLAKPYFHRPTLFNLFYAPLPHVPPRAGVE